MEGFKVIIVEDVPLELKGTLGIIKSDIPEAEVIGTADSEPAYWKILKQQKPQLVLLDLGLGGSTTVGVEICRQTKEMHPDIKVLIFTGEILNEKLWVDVLDAGADGIILKTGELLTRRDVLAVMEGKELVFNEPILEKIVERFKQAVSGRVLPYRATPSASGDVARWCRDSSTAHARTTTGYAPSIRRIRSTAARWGSFLKAALSAVPA